MADNRTPDERNIQPSSKTRVCKWPFDHTVSGWPIREIVSGFHVATFRVEQDADAYVSMRNAHETSAHYPEEWGPPDDRHLTCVCGNPDPFHADRSAQKASEQRIPEGWCQVCGGQNGEHKPGCEPAPGDIV